MHFVSMVETQYHFQMNIRICLCLYNMRFNRYICLTIYIHSFEELI